MRKKEHVFAHAVWLQGGRVSLLLVELSQHVYLFEDFDLEVLDDLRSHFWTLLCVSDTTRVVIDWQGLIDVSSDLLWRITFQSWNSDVIEDWVLKAFLSRWPEERIIFEHFAN